MRATVLGSAAGGGAPQWNCGCANCNEARRPGGRVRPRTQDAVAVEGSGGVVLLNASPDVLRQIEQTPLLHPRGPRGSPIACIVLTNGDLDHVLGLFSLRESTPLVVYATPRVRQGLEGSVFVKTLQRFPTQLTWRALELDRQDALRGVDGAPLGLAITPFAVPGKLPVHLGATVAGSPEDNVGVALSDGARSLAYVTTAGAPGDYLARLDDVDAVLFDGTFFTEDELVSRGLGTSYAKDMAHWPVGGEGGSLARLRERGPRTRVYTHINNSNPMLHEDAPERREVARAGWAIAHDGMTVEP